MSIKENADKILYDLGLLDELENYGTPFVIGSYLMDVMAWNDLDIDVSNENMSLEKMYQLTDFILNKFKPTWYEAKSEIAPNGKTVYFHGFETMVLGELWNVDIWFFDDETVKNAVEFCEKTKSKLDSCVEKRNAVIKIKQDLIGKELYSFDKYTSMDVYRSVLDNRVLTTEEFLRIQNKC